MAKSPSLGDSGPPPALVDSVSICRSIVGLLLQQDEIAVDFEGVDLCREGRLAIVQVCTASDDVFLFDITTMGKSAFDEGRLRELLRSTSVTKVIFDGRSDNDALHHLFDAGMRNAFDLQVQYAYKSGDESDPYLRGLEHCLANSGLLSPKAARRMSSIKAKGKRLFSPDQGGKFERWEKRPLRRALLAYAVADVKYMLPMKKKNAQGSMRKWNDVIAFVTQVRIDRASAAYSPAKGGHMVKRDFGISAVARFTEFFEEYRSDGRPARAAHSDTESDSDSDSESDWDSC